MAVVGAPAVPPEPAGPGPGAGPVQVPIIIVLSLLFAALTVLLIYTVIQAWPPAAPAGASQTPSSTGFNYFGFTVTIPDEARIFIVIVASGAAGGALHTLRSLSWYVGNRNLLWSWVLMYCLLPFVGALLSAIFYVLLRGGLLSAQTSTGNLNVYGFAAIGALVGLFSEQAVTKLKDVFSNLFSPAEQGHDRITPTPSP